MYRIEYWAYGEWNHRFIPGTWSKDEYRMGLLFYRQEFPQYRWRLRKG